MIIPILVSAGGIVAAKFTSDKKANENHKNNVVAAYSQGKGKRKRNSQELHII